MLGLCSRISQIHGTYIHFSHPEVLREPPKQGPRWDPQPGVGAAWERVEALWLPGGWIRACGYRHLSRHLSVSLPVRPGAGAIPPC